MDCNECRFFIAVDENGDRQCWYADNPPCSEELGIAQQCITMPHRQ